MQYGLKRFRIGAGTQAGGIALIQPVHRRSHEAGQRRISQIGRRIAPQIKVWIKASRVIVFSGLIQVLSFTLPGQPQITIIARLFGACRCIFEYDRPGIAIFRYFIIASSDILRVFLSQSAI